MKNTTLKTILWVFLFSMAMGMLESAVVIYLRQLYYPEGFAFPLKMMDTHIVVTEILREAATLIMLIAIGVLAGRTPTEKFAYFISSFAIWDIFYYVFLKLLLNWPESWMTWDILFLLPTTWVGPVLTPVLLSLLMILLCLGINYFTDKSPETIIHWREWVLLVFGSLVTIAAFTWEYVGYLLKVFPFGKIWAPSQKLMDYAIQFVPAHFPWFIYSLGVAIIGTGIFRFTFRNWGLLKKQMG